MQSQVEPSRALPIQCEITKKLLARIDIHGVHLWCKICHKEHCIPWSVFIPFIPSKEPQSHTH